jgi:hypothetical protein
MRVFIKTVGVEGMWLIETSEAISAAWPGKRANQRATNCRNKPCLSKPSAITVQWHEKQADTGSFQGSRMAINLKNEELINYS